MDFSADLIRAILDARRIVVFTGAGVSQESGIPTFRDAMTGLWETFDPGKLATPEGFAANPDLVWGWYEWRRSKVIHSQPNAGHRAIAELAGMTKNLTVVTQNVDDLHERAGSQDVIHLHGSLHKPRCSICGAAHAFADAVPIEPPEGRKIQPPACVLCHGMVRPGVVWFGEELPHAAWAKAHSAAEGCDVLLSVGTSSVVYPAAIIPLTAAQAGARVVQVNPLPTAHEEAVHDKLIGKAGEVLPTLVEVLRRELI